MTRRVLLHVGTPKTGTSFLQDVLFRNREMLAEHDIHYPADRFDAHFLAALDLMRLPWGGLERQAVGAWNRLAEQVMSVDDGTVILSHEILAHASRKQAEHARKSLGVGRDTELHLVISARDLARQIPAEWQENVKHRATLSYARFLKELQDPERDGRISSWFWRVQELPDILERWGFGLPPENIHIVTVPPRGSDPDLLWKRFVDAFDLDGIDLDLEKAERANPSMGSAETALIRRLNRRVNPVVEPADYRPLVRELLVHQTLSRVRHSPPLSLPPDLQPWVDGISHTWVDVLRERGYDVVGHLDDLVGQRSDDVYADPDAPKPRQVVKASMDALEALLVETARLSTEQHELRDDIDRLHRELALAHAELNGRRDQRFRRRLYVWLERRSLGQKMLKAYRKLRGRNSRAA